MPKPKKVKARKTIAAFAAHNKTGWAAVDNYGVTWPISADEAKELPQTRSFEAIAEEYGLN